MKETTQMKMFELLPSPLGSIFRKLTHFTCNSPFAAVGKLYNQVSQIGKARFRGGEQRQKGRKTGNGRGREKGGRHAP
jgi:hypothetical protein